MKNKIKRKLVAFLTMMTMLLSLSCTVWGTNNGTGNLTIQGVDLQGKKVDIYQMFSATWEDKAPAGDVISLEDNVSYTLNPDWELFFQTYLSSTQTGTALSDAAYDCVRALTSANIDAFAKAAGEYALAIDPYDEINSTPRSPLAPTASVASAGAGDVTGEGKAVFNSVAAGYYLVIPQGSVTKNGKNLSLVNVPTSENATLRIKGQYPTVDKKANAEDNTSAKVGDDVTFTLQSTVPDMSDYTTYQFQFVDRMSNGLTFVDDSVTVTIGGKTIPQNTGSLTTGFTFTKATVSGKTQLTIAFNDLKTVKASDDSSISTGDAIVVTYHAKINENAVIGTTGNENTAHVDFSNDPTNTTSTTSSQEDTAKVYTYEAQIDKYTGTYGPSATRLAGAVFQVERSDRSVIQLVCTDPTNSVYRVATAEEIADGTVTKYTTVTTPTSGIITIDGLGVGTYYFEETQAPTGYNQLAEPIQLVISVQNGTNGQPDYTIPYFQIGTGTAATSNIVPIENNTGALLPTTGSIGTIGLTVLGVVVVIAGLVLPSKRKKAKVDE